MGTALREGGVPNLDRADRAEALSEQEVERVRADRHNGAGPEENLPLGGGPAGWERVGFADPLLDDVATVIVSLVIPTGSTAIGAMDLDQPGE